jgi:hypothetical protein
MKMFSCSRSQKLKRRHSNTTLDRIWQRNITYDWWLRRDVCMLQLSGNVCPIRQAIRLGQHTIGMGLCAFGVRHCCQARVSRGLASPRPRSTMKASHADRQAYYGEQYMYMETREHRW